MLKALMGIWAKYICHIQISSLFFYHKQTVSTVSLEYVMIAILTVCLKTKTYIGMKT